MKKIIAVGNAGGNISYSIRKQGIGVEDAEFVYIDTDQESLFNHGLDTDKHILISKDVTGEDKVLADEMTEDVDLVVITAGLGGETGSHCSAAVGWAAGNAGIDTVAFLSMPFHFEGEKKIAKAKECLEGLKVVFDEGFIQENDQLDGGLNMTDMDAILCDKYARRFS